MTFILDEKVARANARLGPRATYGSYMFSIAASRPKWLLLSADLGRSSGLDRLRNEFPEKFINCGIAEQNMVGFAAGLAREGYTVFASSFAPFLSMRASEQVRMNLGYMGEPVKLIALGSGLSMGFLGNSHFGLEDVGVMRLIPGLDIVCPADAGSIPKAIESIAVSGRPTYLRLTGTPGSPTVYISDYDFEIGKALQVRSSDSGVAILATGSMVAPAMGAAQLLEAHGVECGVFDFHTLAPFDVSALNDILERYDVIVTIEEHYISGGLGSIVCEQLIDSGKIKPCLRLGIPNQYIPTGDYTWMLDNLGLNSPKVCKSILQWVSSVK